MEACRETLKRRYEALRYARIDRLLVAFCSQLLNLSTESDVVGPSTSVVPGPDACTSSYRSRL